MLNKIMAFWLDSRLYAYNIGLTNRVIAKFDHLFESQSVCVVIIEAQFSIRLYVAIVITQ